MVKSSPSVTDFLQIFQGSPDSDRGNGGAGGFSCGVRVSRYHTTTQASPPNCHSFVKIKEEPQISMDERRATIRAHL
jgi:hypothetical protein